MECSGYGCIENHHLCFKFYLRNAILWEIYHRYDLVIYKRTQNYIVKQYYVIAPHGNGIQLTDESGKVTKTYEYDSFGNEIKPYGKDDNSFRYYREYYDKETVFRGKVLSAILNP